VESAIFFDIWFSEQHKEQKDVVFPSLLLMDTGEEGSGVLLWFPEQ
jgi:hypothetical protein